MHAMSYLVTQQQVWATSTGAISLQRTISAQFGAAASSLVATARHADPLLKYSDSINGV
jgi:hypothetical protein